MKKIDLEEQKTILLDILEYIDNICRNNEIKYSLIGGSLIGAVRHKGIIPWDDDIDIILNEKDRIKLIELLRNSNHNYYKLIEDNDSLYPFPKLVDTRTILIENEAQNIDDYGVYVDIFAYYNTSNNSIFRFFHFKKIEILKKFITGAIISDEIFNNEKNVLKKFRNKISRKIGIVRIKSLYLKSLCKFSNKNTDYAFSDWPCYGYKHEVQLQKNLDSFIDCEFDGKRSMIFRNYDSVLKTTFGEYMTPPPKEKQITNHNTEVFWK